MNTPIKIIWKYKNSQRRSQYSVYVFVGHVSKDIMDVLQEITKMSLYSTLSKLSLNKYDLMVKTYGPKWYSYFFNIYHITDTISGIRNNTSQKNELTTKFGAEWFKTHIDDFIVTEKRLLYSFESMYKGEQERKTFRKKREFQSDENLDFSISKSILEAKKQLAPEPKQKQPKQPKQHGGQLDEDESSDSDSDSESDSMDESVIEDINKFSNEYVEENWFSAKPILTSSTTPLIQTGGREEEDDVESEQADEDTDQESDTETEKDDENETPQEVELEKMEEENEVAEEDVEDIYKADEVIEDTNTKQTTTMLKTVLGNNAVQETNSKTTIPFDESKDDNIYDELLKDVYVKNYVTSQYIFKDDTVKTMREKICVSLANHKKYGEESYLMPSRLYFWSEYEFEKKINKVMVGQKWVNRNEILKIDIEPNANIRMYEELSGPLKLLRDNLKRLGNKIKREDEDNNIIYDYDNYCANNEIYMLDIYNELGKGYNPKDPEVLRNIQDVYLKLYFYRIKSEDLRGIFDFLNNEPKLELTKIQSVIDTINNDLVMENEIVNIVEETKLKSKYKDIFKDRYITQAVIHLPVRLVGGRKIDLRRIFDQFVPDESYPFIQLQTPDRRIIYKFNEIAMNNFLKKKENADLLTKWFESAPYGISFKVKVTDKNIEKIMPIDLNESGLIEYKTQWKQEEYATIQDIQTTYGHVRKLLEKLNKDNTRQLFENPFDSEFRFAFINSIQMFEFPGKYTIGHNDLSDFARFFYPYVSLVIEPRKRQSKVTKETEKSKFGTYLRYKRISQYENQSRIEQRILYFMKNYEFNDQSLALEISKQFNITEIRAMDEIERVRAKYPNVKKTRKLLKKLENIPKYKPPGIDINIQGKTKENYKIRVSGSKNKEQLDRIIDFMNILMYLYHEVYHKKNPTYLPIKEKLKKLTNIAKRRNKVDEFVDYKKETNIIKTMANIDKQRIGFKPEKGQNQYSRSCQNSGEDKKRRPQLFTSDNIDELLKAGYSKNKKTGVFEKKVTIKENGKKKEVTLKTIKLQNYDEEGNLTGSEVYYGCDPKENGEHFYVGFLTKSNNPFGQCMPCCFKKDPNSSKNKSKQEFFKKCLEPISKEQPGKLQSKTTSEKLYILQDTNKMQDGRFSFLPKYLDIYMNYMLEKDKKIYHHYLVKSSKGYFLKYGSPQDTQQFLNAIATTLDLSLTDIQSSMVKMIEMDKNEQIFTSLNNGDIKSQFGTREEYIKFLKGEQMLDFDMTHDLLTIPKVAYKDGINVIVFNRNTYVVNKQLEKEKVKEDFELLCPSRKSIHDIKNPLRKTIIILKENKNYYPIVMVTKTDENSKSVDMDKTFFYSEKSSNIVNHLLEFYEKNCVTEFTDTLLYSKRLLIAHDMIDILSSSKSKDLMPKMQFVDTSNKVKYVVTQNGLLVPTRPSGSVFNVPITRNITKYIKSLSETLEAILKLNKETKNKLLVEPVGVYFDGKTKNMLHVVAIKIQTDDIIPIIPQDIDKDTIVKMELSYESKPLYHKIDTEIEKGPSNVVVDRRIKETNLNAFQEESYELFRFEFSEYINSPDNDFVKTKIENIISNEKLDKSEKQFKLQLLIYKLIDSQMAKLFAEVSKVEEDESVNVPVSENEPDNEQQQVGGKPSGKHGKLVHVINNIPDIRNYQVQNNRATCQSNPTKETCDTNPHCHWAHGECHLGLTKKMIATFVNKVADELASNSLKAKELLKKDKTFVSDVVNYSKFISRPHQKIIVSSSNTIKKTLHELFGNEDVPQIGKRRIQHSKISDYKQLNAENPLKTTNEAYYQKIINNNSTIFRAFVNGLYWNKHVYGTPETKNLGYIHPIQTELVNYFKSSVIDWISEEDNKNLIIDKFGKHLVGNKKQAKIVELFIEKVIRQNRTSDCVIELFILNKLHNIPMVVYNENNKVIYIIDGDVVYDWSDKKQKEPSNELIEKYTKSKKSDDKIVFRFSFLTNNIIPDDIEVVYPLK